MKNYFCWRLSAAIAACLVVLIAQAGAEIKVRLSVKFINDSTGTPPPGVFGNATGFAQEITRGNQILDDTARGYSLQVVEYLSIQPPAPAGGPVNRTCGTQTGMAVVTCSNTAGLQVCMLVQGPGISMIQEDVLEAGENVALSGRVYVKTDTGAGAIEPGDLLTTSSTAGHAMKAADHDQAQGAIIGKAMTSLNEGTGMVLVLVTLQ